MATIRDRALTRGEVAELLGLSVRTLDRLRREPGFPPPRRVGAGSVRWVRSDVIGWLRSRPAVELPT